MSAKTLETLKIDWIIHYVFDDKTEGCFPEFMINAHTHGLEKYNHLDFQVVLEMPPALTGNLLNEMGLRVQRGERYKDGDIVSDLLQNGYDVRLVEREEMDRKVLRLLIPDENNRFPEDKLCQYPYNFQKDFSTK